MTEAETLTSIAARIRGKLVELSHRAKTPHLGSSLSCVDILVAAYWRVLNLDPATPDDPLRDRLILSKGHAATTLYTALCYRGFFDEAFLDTYNSNGGKLAEHPGPGAAPGIEAATGSLGHGLPIAVGLALGAKIDKHSRKVLAVLSDGECNEGSTWEAAMMAPARGLDNLIAVVDYNKWQATGRSNETLALSPLVDKWRAFGWDAVEVDGHDLDALIDAMTRTTDTPNAIIAHTVKGKGVSFMEDDNNWHYRVPTADEVQAARAELGLN